MIAIAFVAFAILVVAWLVAPTGKPVAKAHAAASNTTLGMGDAGLSATRLARAACGWLRV